MDIGKNTLEELANYIKRNTDPRIFPRIEVLEVEDKRVIVIEVAGLEFIEEDKVRWFLRRAKEERGLAIEEDARISGILTQLNLMRDNKLTNAAILLFSKYPERFFRGCLWARPDWCLGLLHWPRDHKSRACRGILQRDCLAGVSGLRVI